MCVGAHWRGGLKVNGKEDAQIERRWKCEWKRVDGDALRTHTYVGVGTCTQACVRHPRILRHRVYVGESPGARHFANKSRMTSISVPTRTRVCIHLRQAVDQCNLHTAPRLRIAKKRFRPHSGSASPGSWAAAHSASQHSQNL